MANGLGGGGRCLFSQSHTTSLKDPKNTAAFLQKQCNGYVWYCSSALFEVNGTKLQYHTQPVDK